MESRWRFKLTGFTLGFGDSRGMMRLIGGGRNFACGVEFGVFETFCEEFLSEVGMRGITMTRTRIFIR